MEVGFKQQQLSSLYEEDDFMDESPENSTMFMSRSFEKNHLAALMPSIIRGETPDTIMSDHVWYPDLNLYCAVCEEFVFVEDLPDHRQMHRFMAELDIEIGAEQPSLEELTAKRTAAINRLRKKSSAAKVSAVNRVNSAFDFLSKFFHSHPSHHYTYPPPRKELNTDAIFSKGLLCSLASGVGIGAASYQNPDFREEMQDAMVYQDCFGQDPRKCYMAVFNGYDGNYAAQLAADELHHALLCELQRFDPLTACTCAYNMIEGHRVAALEIHRPRTRASARLALHTTSNNVIEQIIHTCEERLDQVASAAADRYTPVTAADRSSTEPGSDLFGLEMASAFTKAFFYTDSLLRRGQDPETYSTIRWSGCGATCLLVRELDDPVPRPNSAELAKLYVANAGANHALLLRQNRHFRLTQSHTPARRKERRRVQEMGGTVSNSKREPLVNGVLPYTRGLGSHGDPALKRCVSAAPYTAVVPLDERCQAVVVASPGLWKVLTEAEVAGLLVGDLPCNRLPAPPDMNVDSLLERRRATTRATTAATTGVATTLGPPETECSGSQGIIDVDDISSGHEADVDTDLGDTPSISMAAMTPAVGVASQIAEQLARKLVQAAMLAGSTENIAVQVALFPAAFSPSWTMVSAPSRRTGATS